MGASLPAAPQNKGLCFAPLRCRCFISYYIQWALVKLWGFFGFVFPLRFVALLLSEFLLFSKFAATFCSLC